MSDYRPLFTSLQSIDLLFKSMDWLLYNRDFRHDRINVEILYEGLETNELSPVLVKVLKNLMRYGYFLPLN